MLSPIGDEEEVEEDESSNGNGEESGQKTQFLDVEEENSGGIGSGDNNYGTLSNISPGDNHQRMRRRKMGRNAEIDEDNQFQLNRATTNASEFRQIANKTHTFKFSIENLIKKDDNKVAAFKDDGDTV